MSRTSTTKSSPVPRLKNLNQQGADALLAATFEFLRRNKITRKSIIQFARNYRPNDASGPKLRAYREIVRTYEKMGVIMATWFSNPEFLDKSGKPLPLLAGSTHPSIGRLIQVAGARIKPAVAIAFMKQSPSIQIGKDGSICAARRVFVIPHLEVPRAAFVVERYLETIQQISSSRQNSRRLILERSCHVSEVDLAKKAPLLRDIECRATALLDSIDADLEHRRLRKNKRKQVGELGVHIFAWTRPSRVNRSARKDSEVI